MSSSQWVNYGIGLVAGIVVGVFTAGIGLAAYATFAGLTVGSITATMLQAKYGAKPGLGGLRPPSGFGNSGGQTGTKDAAAASLQINSASESTLIPVVFGLCRMNANIVRYDYATYRSVPVIERVQVDPSVVAYEMAQRVYKRNPSRVNHEINRAADKANQGSAGGKGGAPSQPPPSQSYNQEEKIQAYTQVILDKTNGGRKLPKEYEEYIVGYKYYLSWELVACMGPVDALHSVRVYPGEFAAVDRSASPELLSAETVLTGQGGDQGGTIRFYRGTADQTRNVADVYATPHTNYRNVCFAVMQDYYMGENNPAPSSYAFDVERLPVCLDAAGDVIAGMKTRGSADTLNPSYRDANPAAILWEIFTNKLWGKGMDPALMDQASFVKASEYFEDQGIGMSFSLEGPSLVTEAVDTVRSHVNTTVVWAGGKLYCRCLLDASEAYSPMVVLTSDNVIEPSVTRPTWPSTSNELRGTFMNRLNNFNSEIAIVHDNANIATVGRINSANIDLPAFSTRAVTERALRRMSIELSYPQATLKFKMNRFETRLQPGHFMAFIWTEWSAGPVTTYWRVTEITDQDQDNNGLHVMAIEDLNATAQQGAITEFTPPVPAFDGVTVNDDSDLYFGDNHGGPFDAGATNLQVVEMPISLTDGDRILAFFSQRQNGLTKDLHIHWRENGSGDDWKSLGRISPWAITGTLVADLPAQPQLTRNASFELELTYPAERANFLSLCATAPTAGDHLDIVTGSETNILRLGNELLQVALASAGSTSTRVKIDAVIRGQFGTDAQAHTAGTKAAFVYEFIPFVMTLRHDELPIGVAVDFQATPFDRYGLDDDPVIETITLENRARKALAVESFSCLRTGDDFEVTFRPRFHNRGADANADLEGMLNTLTGAIPEGYAFAIQPRNASNVALADAAPLTVTFTPDDGTDPATGMAAFDYSAPSGTDHLLLFQSFNGILGYPVQIE